MRLYRIIVETKSPTNPNIDPGTYYCFTKKSLKEQIKTYIDADCKIKVEEFMWLHKDVFTWLTYTWTIIANFYLSTP